MLKSGGDMRTFFKWSSTYAIGGNVIRGKDHYGREKLHNGALFYFFVTFVS